MEFWTSAKINENESSNVSNGEVVRPIANLMGVKRGGPDF